MVGSNMHSRFLRCSALLGSLLGLSITVSAGTLPGGQNGGDFSQNPDATPLPEGGRVADHDYNSPYFGLTYPLPTGWIQGYDGPPPSDSGLYVLAQIQPADTLNGASRGSLLITAQDMFFTPEPAGNPLELLTYTSNHLQADYKVEQPPAEVRIAGHTFVRLAYTSPVAKLHWYVLATQIRCHTVQFVFTSHDPRLIGSLVRAMSKMTLPAEIGLQAETSADDVPVCIKDYASTDNVVTRVEPMFSERRGNPVPVRLIIGADGKVKHIHFISAFPNQAKSITDAVMQWQFKPYSINGRPVEVETGILFGRVARPAPAKTLTADSASNR
jgi:hypothetical protein